MYRTSRALIIALVLSLVFVRLTSAQQQFDVAAYRAFLRSHASLSSQDLMGLHPAGAFAAAVNGDALAATYCDSIVQKFSLTGDEVSLLRKNGFVVSERLSDSSFGTALLDIFHKDLPVFISTDAILHAIHMSYDGILRDIETAILIPQLTDMLRMTHEQIPFFAASYMEPGIQKSLDDCDLYLTVARTLLGDSVPAYRTANQPMVRDILAYVRAQQPHAVALFGETQRTLDFSQFTPRGHYTQSEKLTRYFQSMIWIGRTELQLLAPENTIPPIPPKDIQRQTIDSYLLLEMLERSAAIASYDSIDLVIRTMVGESDNVTITNLRTIQASLGFSDASSLLDEQTLAEFQRYLSEQPFVMQRINSQILFSDPMNPELVKPPSAFLLLGQRFVVDSYVTGSVVYDKILFEGNKIFRQLPSTLDVLFALGNNAAAQLLQTELDQYHYGPNLAAARYLIDAYDSTFWQSSLYNGWLGAIRSLNPPADRSQLPSFMQTGAWWQQKINTQLASWTQLRHDNLLYAKQSYTGGIACSFPRSFVEPVPEFYRSVGAFARNARDAVQALSVPTPQSYLKNNITGYFSRLAKVADTLGIIAQKELRHEVPNLAEQSFLQKMLYIQVTCGLGLNGWYPRLFYVSWDDCKDKDLVVADVHTAPTDEAGNMVGKVLHIGTGPVNLAVVVTDLCDGEPMAFIGPVMSYYEHVTLNFKRLTDEEWKTMYGNAPSIRPSWTNAFLADIAGAQRPSGISLITGVNTGEPVKPPMAHTAILYPNFPNPFNPTTVIPFSLPEQTNIRLEIFDVTGKLVRKLVEEELQRGEYLVRWDGKTDAGTEATSAVYFVRLTTGHTSSQIIKMLLMR